MDLVDVLSGIEDLGGWVRGRGVMEVCSYMSSGRCIVCDLRMPV